MKNKHNGFSLSEVIITIGIIGVVFAIILTVTINKISDMHFNSLRKKALSSIEQAYWQIYEEQGEFPESLCTVNDSKCFGNFFEKKLKSQLAAEWIPNKDQLPECWNSVLLTNIGEWHYCISTISGIFYDFDMEFTNGTPFINIDVNGSKKPNKWGKDIYLLRIYKHKFKVYRHYNATKNEEQNVFE